MEDQIILFNGSILSNDFIAKALLDISHIRDLKLTIVPNGREIMENFARRHYNPTRKQVDASGFLHDICGTDIGTRFWRAGKLMFIDYDLYDGRDPNSNWFFGWFAGTDFGLGYITMSAARLQDKEHARDLIRHEAGHMFGAPSDGRRNTYEHLGLHCSNSLCVMQQKDTVEKSVRYAHERARRNAATYCPQCQRDIAGYVVRE